MRLRGFLAPVLALLQREAKREDEAVASPTMTLTNRDGAMPFTNVKRTNERRAHSIKKELRRELDAEKMSPRQWRRLRKAMRRGLNDD